MVLEQNYPQMVNRIYLVDGMKLLVHDQDFLFLFVHQYVVLLENDLMLLNIVLVNFLLKFFYVSKKNEIFIKLNLYFILTWSASVKTRALLSSWSASFVCCIKIFVSFCKRWLKTKKFRLKKLLFIRFTSVHVMVHYLLEYLIFGRVFQDPLLDNKNNKHKKYIW